MIFLKRILYKLKYFYKKYGYFIVFKAMLHKMVLKFKKENDGITVVITSAGRLEYLKKTIESLRNCVDSEQINKIYWYIIDDNPTSIKTRDYIKSLNFDLVLLNKKNKGLGYSLNKIYSKVKTKFIFHCEDDWLFNENLPLNDMIVLLENNKHIAQALLNRDMPYKEKAIEISGKKYAQYDKTHSFNPHLTTKKVGLTCLPFPMHNTEREITNRLRKKGLTTAILGYDKINYVTHIGIEKVVTKY
ncbi:glycosyltransferase family A protein [Xanthomarina gelatinilytica]|uniref:glycosyltransferase family A protein n=1 Tax=Xanthomarina gelatinilytica TaxID=1137281 RepID=UPI003AA9B698